MDVSMTRRGFLSTLGVAAGGAALAACTPPVTPAPEAKPEAKPEEKPAVVAPKETEVRYASWWGTFNAIRDDVTADFNDVHPDIKIKFEEIGYSETEQKYPTMLVAGTAPDILYHMNFMSRFYDQDLILDLTEYFERDGFDFWDDFYRGLALNDWEGKIYAFPHMLHTCFILYNKTMIEKEWGQDLWEAFPDGMWDITDMIEVAKACTKDTSGDGIIDQWGLYINHRHWYYGLETLGWTRGDDMFDLPNVKFNLTSETIDGVIHDLYDWVMKDGFSISQEDYSEVTQASAVGAPFYAGKTALRHRLSGDVNRALLSVGDKFEWDLMYLPNDGDNLAISEANGHGHNIPKTSPVADSAWEYAKFLGTSPGLSYMAKTKDSVPVYRKDPELRKMLETGEPRHSNIIMGTLEDRGGYGDHMRFHNEGECLNLYRNRFDLIFNDTYENVKPTLSAQMKELEDELNAITDYGEEPPFEGIEFPFKPLKKV